MTVGDADALEIADQLRPSLVALSHFMRRQTTQSNLSMRQSAVLGALRDGASRRVSDLAEVEHLRVPTMIEALARMEKAGWVEKHADRQDRRVVLVRITPAGRSHLADAIDYRNQSLAQLIDGLGAADRQALREAATALSRLVAAEQYRHDVSSRVASS